MLLQRLSCQHGTTVTQGIPKTHILIIRKLSDTVNILADVYSLKAREPLRASLKVGSQSSQLKRFGLTLERERAERTSEEVVGVECLTANEYLDIVTTPWPLNPSRAFKLETQVSGTSSRIKEGASRGKHGIQIY